MSELLSRAVRLHNEQSKREADLRRFQVEYNQRQKELREQSAQRAAEFIGLMKLHSIPKRPIYREIYKPGQSGRQYAIQIPSETVGYGVAGEGWVLSPRYYPSGEETGRKWFMTDDGQVWESHDTASTHSAGERDYFSTSRIPEAEIADITRSPMDNLQDISILFAGDEGLAILTNALTLHRVID